MKRILTVLPAVICLIISLCVPVSALADDYSNPTECIIPVDWFTDNAPLKKYYFHMAYSYNPDSSPSDTEVDTIFFHTDQEPEVVTEPGKITITFTNDVSYRLVNCRVDRGIMGGNPGTFKTVVIDTVNKTASFDGYSYPNNTQYKHNISSLKFDYKFDSLSSVLPDVIVEFTPDLSGTVSRDVSVNGNNSKLQSISMYIENRSSFNIQYSMRIYKADQNSSRWDYENPDNYSRDNLSTSFDDDPVFIYYSNTEVYSHIKTDSKLPGLGYHNPSSLYTKASYFHKLSSGQSETVTFPLSMINLSENVNYRVIVSAYKLDYDYVSESSFIPGFSDVDKSNYEYDRETLVDAYDSVFSFSDLSGVKYDPNKTYGNILPYNGSNGITDQKRYSVNYDAVTDLKTGETKIGHVDNFNDDSYWESIGVPFQKKNNAFIDDLNTNINASSFSGMFSNVFGAVSMFMNYLPSSINSIYIFGFSSIVVIAVIKAVR